MYYSRGKNQKVEEISQDTQTDKGQRWLINARMTKSQLTNYLKNRYASRVANKLAAIFDWQNTNIEYTAFF